MAEYLTANQVAEITGYSVDTVRAKFADGSLPAHRLGRGHWRATEAEIRDAMQGRVTQRGQGAPGFDFAACMREGIDRAAVRVARRIKAQKGAG
jgi:excisionase family DNA binding protein